MSDLPLPIYYRCKNYFKVYLSGVQHVQAPGGIRVTAADPEVCYYICYYASSLVLVCCNSRTVFLVCAATYTLIELCGLRERLTEYCADDPVWPLHTLSKVVKFVPSKPLGPQGKIVWMPAVSSVQLPCVLHRGVYF